MFPLLVVSQTPADFEEFFAEYRRRNKITNSQIFSIEPVKTELGIAQIRDLKRTLLTSATMVRYIVIKGLDAAGVEVQNALLKTLEEKNIRNQFIMPITSLSRMLPTIQSRCKVMYGTKNVAHTINPKTYSLLENVMASNNLQFLGDEALQGITREDAETFLLEVMYFFKQKLPEMSVKAATIIKQTMILRNLLQNNNLNPSLSADMCLLSIYRTLH